MKHLQVLVTLLKGRDIRSNGEQLTRLVVSTKKKPIAVGPHQKSTKDKVLGSNSNTDDIQHPPLDHSRHTYQV